MSLSTPFKKTQPHLLVGEKIGSKEEREELLNFGFLFITRHSSARHNFFFALVGRKKCKKIIAPLKGLFRK